MATPAELVRTIARVTGVAETTVINHDRNLAKAGYRTVGGRGTGAARMTVRDAKNLLLAVAGAPLVKDSIIPIEKHANLLPGTAGKDGTGIRWDIPFVHIPELACLPERHTFGDALEALLTAAVNGTLEEELSKAVDLGHPTLNVPVTQIEISIVEPLIWASVEVYVHDHKNGEIIVRDPSFKVEYWFNSKTFMERFTGDLLNHHRFTERTLIEVGNLLRD